MRFLTDANLHFALVQRLAERGRVAEHVITVAIGALSDVDICVYAEKTGAIVISKDADFADLSRRTRSRVQFVWIRLGNTRNARLWAVGWEA